jgi:hypothetical protein
VWTFHNLIRFTVNSCLHLAQNPSRKTTPCRLSPTAYSIYSQLPSILEAVPPSTIWGRAMPWWQGPTYYEDICVVAGIYPFIDSTDLCWNAMKLHQISSIGSFMEVQGSSFACSFMEVQTCLLSLSAPQNQSSDRLKTRIPPFRLSSISHYIEMRRKYITMKESENFTMRSSFLQCVLLTSRSLLSPFYSRPKWFLFITLLRIRETRVRSQ